MYRHTTESNAKKSFKHYCCKILIHFIIWSFFSRCYKSQLPVSCGVGFFYWCELIIKLTQEECFVESSKMRQKREKINASFFFPVFVKCQKIKQTQHFRTKNYLDCE